MELCGESARETERFAVTAATGALGPVLVKLNALLCAEYKLQEGTRRRIESIKSELEPVHHLLGKLWGREDLDVACKDWMAEARELSYDMEDAIDCFAHGLERGGGGFIQLEATDDGPLKEFMERIKGVSKRCPEMQAIGDAIVCNRSKLTTDPRVNFLHKDASELVGMEEKKEELINLLRLHEMVCVVGFAGMGKTTLADLVYQTVGDQFQCRAFVSVHQSPNMTEILGAILSQVTNNGATSTGSATEAASEQNIINDILVSLSDKRYLVIIDDIWHWKEWEIIRKALPKNNQGCKIIMTTRIKTTAEKCQTEQGAHVYAQSFDFSNVISLVNRRLNKSATEDYRLSLADYRLYMDIARTSCEMPLAAICLSSAWEESHAQGDWDTFKSYLLGGFLSIPSMKPLVQSLCLYFEDLSVHLRTCLLYCSIFPPNSHIRRECLVRIWTAEGFVSQEEVAEAYIDLLVSRNLLQPAAYGENSYRVHPTMLGFLECKAKEDNFVACGQYSGPSGSCYAKQIRRLSLYRADHCPDKDLSHTRSLVVCRSPDLDGLTLDKFANLRVLEIDIDGRCNDSHLVDICRVMILLRYLCLKAEQIRELPREIGRLQYLEILDIAWTSIYELPTEICKLQRLKILDVSRTGVSELPKEIWKLQHLRTLNISGTKVTKLPTEITKLELLKNLDVSRTGVRELPKEIRKLQHLRTLNISGTKVTELPTEITKLELLKNLDVSWTGVRELPKEIRKLQHLSTLDVRGTKVRELSWEFPNSLSVLVGDEIPSRVVKLPQAVSAHWVISSSGAERREDLSIVFLDPFNARCKPLEVPLLRVYGRHLNVPQWLKQDLGHVSSLDIRLCKLGEKDLEILKQMPNLQAIALRLEVLPRKPIAITDGGFSKLETFYVDCRLPRVITFEEGAMPKLKHLEFKFYNGTARQGYSMGIKNLVSLEKVVFRCSEYYTSDGPGICETIEVVRKEAADHPNEITLCLNGMDAWESEIRKKAERICEQRHRLLTAVQRRVESKDTSHQESNKWEKESENMERDIAVHSLHVGLKKAKEIQETMCILKKSFAENMKKKHS